MVREPIELHILHYFLKGWRKKLKGIELSAEEIRIASNRIMLGHPELELPNYTSLPHPHSYVYFPSGVVEVIHGAPIPARYRPRITLAAHSFENLKELAEQTKLPYDAKQVRVGIRKGNRKDPYRELIS